MTNGEEVGRHLTFPLSKDAEQSKQACLFCGTSEKI